MNDLPLTETYGRYLRCLNDRRWEDLGQYVCDDAIHNKRPLGLTGYREVLESDTAAIPDLQFHAEIVVAQHDVLGAVLTFHCTPEQRFRGLEPTGAQISFSEHVFYRFRDSRIAEVWSLIDTEAIAAQLGR
ncbi:ester cyclase [Mycobacterium sp. ITM-2016-00317]|uniref:ester cyclase n=1 Tax=Mycobacterium sp. ITM-2016-00317 TaxID=2099694 RepID=UPI000D410C9B|nr:ester cyclase [Mycobacterium sp. ITM-2016-00317]WNG85440.1 ester cyclase [Mycobacterium sp. ITM-2016-00317]